MIYIKVHGERNSGTRFLDALLKRNTKNAIVLEGGTNSPGSWTHGYPDFNEKSIIEYKEGDNKLVYIFVVRDLTDWLNSLFRNPYEIKPRNSFIAFIDTDIVSRHPVPTDNINADDRETQNIFEVRYGKFKMYKEFMKRNNAVLVKLSYLQKEPEKFLNVLSDEFGIELEETIDTIKQHTKTGREERNRNYNKHDIPKSVLKRRTDSDLETEIDSLSYKVTKNG